MRVNIMGSAPGWEDTPVNDGFIWGVNNTHALRDVDRIVDIHVNRLNPTEEKDKNHITLLKQHDIEAYMIDEIEGMPNVKRYPIEEIMKEFKTDYFGSGIDYIIALAMYEGATAIHLYGVAMLRGGEYAHQKPSVDFWCGYAMGRGIEFEVHGEHTEIMRTHNGLMYGYQKPQGWVKKFYPDELTLEDIMEKYEREDIED